MQLYLKKKERLSLTMIYPVEISIIATRIEAK